MKNKTLAACLALTFTAIPQVLAADVGRGGTSSSGSTSGSTPGTSPGSPETQPRPDDDRVRTRQSSPYRRLPERRPPQPMISPTPDGSDRGGMSDTTRGTSEAPRGTIDGTNRPTTPTMPTNP